MVIRRNTKHISILEIIQDEKGIKTKRKKGLLQFHDS